MVTMAVVLSMPGLLVGPTSGFMALMQLSSALMFLAPEPPKAERIVLNRTGPALAAALGRAGPAPHLLKHSGERVLHLTWAAQ